MPDAACTCMQAYLGTLHTEFQDITRQKAALQSHNDKLLSANQCSEALRHNLVQQVRLAPTWVSELEHSCLYVVDASEHCSHHCHSLAAAASMAARRASPLNLAAGVSYACVLWSDALELHGSRRKRRA